MWPHERVWLARSHSQQMGQVKLLEKISFIFVLLGVPVVPDATRLLLRPAALLSGVRACLPGGPEGPAAPALAAAIMPACRAIATSAPRMVMCSATACSGASACSKSSVDLLRPCTHVCTNVI